jgi:hypothetical protein
VCRIILPKLPIFGAFFAASRAVHKYSAQKACDTPATDLPWQYSARAQWWKRVPLPALPLSGFWRQNPGTEQIFISFDVICKRVFTFVLR